MSVAQRATFWALALALLPGIAPTHAAENQWRKLPPLPARGGPIRVMALDGDTLWAMGGTSLAYWEEDGQWRTPGGLPLKAGTYLTKLLGGGDGPLYVTQAASGETDGTEKKGVIYRLRKSGVQRVAEFDYDSPAFDPGIDVSPSGQIIQKTANRLALLREGQWITAREPNRFDAGGPRKPDPFVFESKTAMHALYPQEGRLIDIDRDGNVWYRRVPIGFPNKNALPIRAVRWGENSVLLFRFIGRDFQGLNLATGEPSEVKTLAEQFDKHLVQDAFATRDGSAWIVMRDSAAKEYLLVRVRPNGECERVPGLPREAWQQEHFLRNPRSVLEAQDGAIWLALPHHGLVRIENGQVSRHGPETGYDLRQCGQLLEDRAGNLYSANGGGIYVRYGGDPPANLRPPRTPEPADKPVWTWRRDPDKTSPLAAAWKAGPAIYASMDRGVFGKGPGIIALDTARGKLRWQTKVEYQGASVLPWLLGTTDAGLLEIATFQRIVRANAETGELVEEFALRHDPRIAPVRVGDGYVVVPAPRGKELARVDGDGKIMWQCRLPGYVMLHPTVERNLCVLQTRGESYGGQQTLAVDTDSGAIRWQDETNAYGCGTAFLGDKDLLFESNSFLSPQFTEGWLICRDAETGKVRWRHSREGSIAHAPLVDQRTGKVYGLFGTHVVCLGCADGRVVWEQSLPEPCLALGAGNSYHAAWSPHSLVDGNLLVVDRNYVLHVLDAESGEFQASVMLRHDGPTALPADAQLVAPPWPTADALVVAFTEGIVAFPLPKSLRGE